MRRFSLKLLIVVSLLGLIVGGVFTPCWAKESLKSKVLRGFRKWYSTVRTFKAEFQQATFNPAWGEEQKAGGEFLFKKPGIMRWEYLSSQKDIIIINKEGFFWYVPEDNQVIKKTRDELFQTMSPMSILGEKLEIEKYFDITEIEQLYGEVKEKPGGSASPLFYVLHLQPKKKQETVKKITIKVKADHFSLAAIEVEEQLGSRNKIEFINVTLNPKISPELFVYTPIPGAKEITPKDFPSL